MRINILKILLSGSFLIMGISLLTAQTDSIKRKTFTYVELSGGLSIPLSPYESASTNLDGYYSGGTGLDLTLSVGIPLWKSNFSIIPLVSYNIHPFNEALFADNFNDIPAESTYQISSQGNFTEEFYAIGLAYGINLGGSFLSLEFNPGMLSMNTVAVQSSVTNGFYTGSLNINSEKFSAFLYDGRVEWRKYFKRHEISVKVDFTYAFKPNCINSESSNYTKGVETSSVSNTNSLIYQTLKITFGYGIRISK